jgi:hypothetical protein|tara:strand:+ start:804 stop:1169 length:366 start_codon:yes stop_codon:yes gene_type:complete
MKLWKIVLFALIAIASSCSIQKKPQIQITHVLAVTQEGDTLKIPIDVIRPINYRIINYSSGYGYSSWYKPYHNTYYNYNYSQGSTTRSSNNNSNNNNSNKIVPRDNPDKRPSGEVLLKGRK